MQYGCMSSAVAERCRFVYLLGSLVQPQGRWWDVELAEVEAGYLEQGCGLWLPLW